MVVPARPTPGAPIASDWGGVVHDTAVAMDIQSGTAVVNTSGGTGATTVTFPRPFGSVGLVVVVANVSANGSENVLVDSVTPTSCRITVKSGTTFGYTVTWLAYGPRA